MTHKQAVAIAIKAMQAQMKPLHVDANLYARYGADYPHARNSYQRRERLRLALIVLEKSK